MKILARQLTVDMYGCKTSRLSDLDFVTETIQNAIKSSGLTYLDTNIQVLENSQLTALTLLHEGHISIHTYPELGYTAVDIFICSTDNRPEKAIHVLRRFLQPEKTKTTYLKRGDFGLVKDMKPKIKISVAPFRRIRNTGARVMHLLSKKKNRG